MVGKWWDNYEEMSARKYWIIISVVLLIALLVRIAALVSLSGSIYYDYLLFDERLYHDWAVQIMKGTWRSTSVYEFSPFFAYFMAFIYKLFSPDILFIRIANILAGVLTCLSIGFIGNEIAGRKAGLASLIIAALYMPMIFYSIVPLKTMMSVCFFSLFMWLFLRSLRDRSAWFLFAVAGSIAGVMVNIRPNYLIVLPAVIFCVFFFGGRDQIELTKIVSNVLLFAMGFTVIVMPFVVRNYRVAGEVALTVSQSGSNLYIGNNPDSDIPYYRPVSFASSSPFKQGIQFNIEAGKRVGEKLSAKEASSFWTHEVFRIAQEQPGKFFWKLFQKTLTIFNTFEAGDHYHIGFISNYAPFFKIPLLSFALILPFGMMGMVAGMVKRERNVAIITLFFVVYCLSLVAFFSPARFRLPLVVILIPLAVYSIKTGFNLLQGKNHKQFLLMALVGVLFVVIEFLPVFGTDDMTAYYNTHALILNARGRSSEAVSFWERSAQMNRPYSAFANLSLASYYKRKGNFEKAISYLDTIDDNSIGASGKYEMLGDIMMGRKNFPAAEKSFRKAIEINSGQISTRRKLIRLLQKTDSEAAAKESEHYKKILTYYE